MRVGIDVGGTNTDGVLMDGDRVVASCKTATTPDVTSGIKRALTGVLADPEGTPVEPDAVMIGTTHFTNAVVEGKHLARVGVIRLCLPAAASLPPMCDWPARLHRLVKGALFVCHGGHEFDGTPIAPLDVEELRRACAQMADEQIRSIAISSVFSPVNAEFEREAAEVVWAELGDAVSVSLSHEIGRLGLLERENATIMNASLRSLGAEIVGSFRRALRESGIHAEAFISQNDGTLMSLDWVERYPVSTFASGPTNSMRGAALLSGLEDCAVVDIGGTTADVGMLRAGFPREATDLVEIAGVRTNFRMPDVLPLAIGGGTVVRLDPLSVGPDSVGHELTTRARVFGGDTLTASDVAVAAGRGAFGDPGLVEDLDDALLAEVLGYVDASVADAIDRMKTEAADIPVVVVGGGSVLLSDELPGSSHIVRPDHFDVANAVGAAIAQVGGEVDVAYSLAKVSKLEALADAEQQATERAVAAGAARSTVAVVDMEQTSIPYVGDDAIRIRLKVVGDLALRENAC